MAALYRNHPYGIPVIGWEHEMKQLDREDALSFYDPLLRAGETPFSSSLAMWSRTTCWRLAEETFGKIPRHGEAIERTRPTEPEHDGSVTVTLEDPRAGRTTVQRYYIAPSYASAKPGEAEALDLLARVMAHGTTGRVYKHLVMKEKAAASAGGWYSDAGPRLGADRFLRDRRREEYARTDGSRGRRGDCRHPRKRRYPRRAEPRPRRAPRRVCVFVRFHLARGPPIWLAPGGRA